VVTARLKSGVWIQARVRQCDLDGVPAVVVRCGDPDAGAILVKLNRAGAGCVVYTRFRDMEGETSWMPGTGDEPVEESAADAYIERQTARDRDLWVLEIEDHRGDFTLDEN
jgi:hypothetical protein